MCVYGCAPFLVLVCHSSTHSGRLLSHRLTLCCVLGAAAVELPPVGVEASSRLVTSHKKKIGPVQCCVLIPVGHHPGLVSQKPKHESQEINNDYLEVLVFLPIFIVKKVCSVVVPYNKNACARRKGTRYVVVLQHFAQNLLKIGTKYWLVLGANPDQIGENGGEMKCIIKLRLFLKYIVCIQM